jgi:hypothetical protein
MTGVPRTLPSSSTARALTAALVIAVAASAAGAADVIDTIVLNAGPQAFAIGTVPLNGQYTMVVTGKTRRELSPDFSEFDALYCFAASASDSPCVAPDGHRTDIALAFYLQTGSETPGLDQLKSTFAFIDSIPYPPKNDGHAYELPFTAGNNTRLYVVAWPELDSNTFYTVTGQFVIEVKGEPPKQDKSVLKCKRAIAKGSADYFEARLKALAGCQKRQLAGKIPVGDCRAEEKARAAINKAQEKMEDAIDRACGGRDNICGSLDDLPLDSIGFGTACPDFEEFGCTNTLRSCGDVAACLLCIDAVAVDQGMTLLGKMGLSDPKTQKPLNKCQRTVVDASTSFLAAFADVYAKCSDKFLQKKGDPSCINGPDGTRIGKLEAKRIRTIDKACLAPDGHVFTDAEIGFNGICPNVRTLDPPDASSSCYQSGVGNAAGLSYCSQCLSQIEARCAVYAATPAVRPYPVECTVRLPPAEGGQ